MKVPLHASADLKDHLAHVVTLKGLHLQDGLLDRGIQQMDE